MSDESPGVSYKRVIEWAVTLLSLVFSGIIIAYFQNISGRLDEHSETLAIVKTNQTHLSTSVDALQSKVNDLPSKYVVQNQTTQISELKGSFRVLEKEMRDMSETMSNLKFQIQTLSEKKITY